MSNKIDRAIRSFELQRSHSTIYSDPNVLVEAGFPGSFLLPLIEAFKSTETYKYYRDGKFVNEMIGISHGALISAIAKHLGVPDTAGQGLTGRGFVMQAEIEGIHQVLNDNSRRQDTN